MPTARTAATLVWVALLVGSAAACGGGTSEEQEGDGDSGRVNPQLAAPPGSSEPPGTAPSAPVPEGLTPPGTRLDLGEPATVALTRTGIETPGTAEVTIESVEQVPSADAAAAGSSVEEGLWLIRGTLRVVDPPGDPLQPTVNLSGRSDDRPVRTADPEVDDALDCPPLDLSSRTEAGERFDICASALAEPGTTLQAAWTVYGTDYSADPVVWED